MTSMVPSPRNRPLAALAVTALLALTACGGQDEEAPRTSGALGGPVDVRWIYDGEPTSAYLPVLKGLQEGWFEDAGLNVLTTPGGRINGLESLSSGRHDITAGGGVDLLLGQARGLSVRAVGVVQAQALNGLICRPGNGIEEKQPQTLQRRTLATAGGKTDDVVWQIWRDQNKLSGQVEEVSPNAGLPLLYQSVVDCFPVFLTRAPVEAERQFGRKPVVFPYAEQVGVIGQVLDVSNAFAEQNPQAVARFVDVYARGMQWAAQNQAEAVDLMLKKYPKADEIVTTVELKVLSGAWASTSSLQKEKGYLAMDDSSWKPTVEVLRKTGKLDPGTKLADVYTADFLPRKSYRP